MGGKKRRRESEPETPGADPDMDSAVNQMVQNIINSPTFLKTITEVVERQMKQKKSSDQLQVLEDVCHSIFKSSFRKDVPRNPFPANDLISTAFSQEENAIRLQMAAAFRLMDGCGWSSNLFCPATAKCGEYFIVNPSNLHNKYITAENFLRTDKDGNIVYSRNSKYASLSKKNFLLNAAIHATYCDVKCVIQLKYPPCVAVAAVNTGLLEISPEALALGKILYVDLRGKNELQKSEILQCFHPNTKVIISKNRGFFILGESIQQALYLANKAIAASEIQVSLMPLGLDKLTYSIDKESDDEENFKSFWDLHLEHLMKMAEKESQNYHRVSPSKRLKMIQDDLSEIPSTNIKLEGYIVVADTNSYIHDCKVIKQLLQPNTLYKGENVCLYLPWIVLKELDDLKERSQVSNFARHAINVLHKNLAAKNSRLQHQTLDEYEVSCSCFELNNDDRILQSCRILQALNKVILLTDDTNLQCEAILAKVEFSSTIDCTSNLQVPLQQTKTAVNSKRGKGKSSARKSATVSCPSMSDEDKQAIERLKATGFEESLLIEAFFKNGRDETRTVDYILTSLSGN